MNEIIKQSPDFGNLAGIWLATAQIAPKTRKTYQEQILEFHRWMVSQGLVLQDLNSMHATQYSDYLVALAQEDRIAQSTVNLRIAACKSLFSFAANKNFFQNIFSHVRTSQEHTRIENLRKRALTYEEFTAILDRYDAENRPAHFVRNRALIYLAAATGARLNEVRNIKLEHVVVENDMIVCRVKRKGDKFYSRFLPPVPVASTPGREVLAWLEYRLEEHALVGGDADPGYLFCSVGSRSLYKQLTSDTVNRIVTTPLRELGLYDGTATFHGLRHFYGELTAETEGIHAAQLLLGHKDISTTQRYAKEAIQKRNAEAQSRITSYF